MHAELIEDLAQQAKNDLNGVLSNPIWKQIYDENQDFAQHLPCKLKLELLRYIHEKWDGFEIPDESESEEVESENEERGDDFNPSYFEDILCGIEIDIDPWETADPGVIYPVSEGSDEPGKTFDLGSGWTATFLFEEPDLSMEDVNFGSEERFSLASLLPIFFRSPNQDLREAAQSCDMDYESAMSPTDGGYFRLASLNLCFHDETIVEIEAGDEMEEYFDKDSALADSIQTATGNALPIATIEKDAWQKTLFKPIFDGRPVAVNVDALTTFGPFMWWSESGIIDVKWCCECWIPSLNPSEIHSLKQDDSLAYHKKELSIEFSACGGTCYDYEINYALQTVAELKSDILNTLNSEAAHDLNKLYLIALGLEGLGSI